MKIVDRIDKLRDDPKECSKFIQKTIHRRIRAFKRSKFENLLKNIFGSHPNQALIVNELLILRDKLATGKMLQFDLHQEIVNVFNKLR